MACRIYTYTDTQTRRHADTATDTDRDRDRDRNRQTETETERDLNIVFDLRAVWRLHARFYASVHARFFANVHVIYVHVTYAPSGGYLHVHIYEPKICTYAYINYIRKIFFQSIFLLPHLGAVLGRLLSSCVCVRARSCVCACPCVRVPGRHFRRRLLLRCARPAVKTQWFFLIPPAHVCVRERDPGGGRGGDSMSE